MQLVFIRNVKFSAAECNSFNMRKKFSIYLASKKFSGGSHAKKQPSRSKVTNIKMQFQIFSVSTQHIFQPPTPHPTSESSPLKLHKYTLKLYNYAVLKGLHCTSMVVTLHPDGCSLAWLPPLVFQEAESPMFFFLILNELHSAAENFTFLMKTNYIPYENALHSLPECI